MKIQVTVFWIVRVCNYVVGYRGEDVPHGPLKSGYPTTLLPKFFLLICK